jgi:hypothetical protein
MADGGVYMVIVSDATSRTYTFTGCTNTHFTVANGATTASLRTVYTILKTTEAGPLVNRNFLARKISAHIRNSSQR